MAYIGHSPSTGEDNNFKILDDISSYTLTFDGSSSSVVSASDDTIYSYDHRFITGQRVTYNNGGGGNISGLTSGTAYFIIKQDHNNIKLATTAARAISGTAIDISLSGTSGTSHTLNVAFDGVNTKFKATHTTGKKARITRGAQLVLSVNGVIQQPHDSSTPSTGFGFDLDSTIVFSQAPQSTDAFWGHILTNNNVTFDISDNKVDHFSGDGSTSSFTLSKSPPNNENILVTIDGVVQYPNDGAGNIRAYSVAANVINFTTAPGSGTQIEVRHIGFAGATSGGGGGVTGFYGRTGNAVLKSTDNITVNDAAITGDATVTGDATITGDLTVNGTTTTIDTTLKAVDRIEVADSSTNVAVAVTQSSTGSILKLFDGSSEVFSVDDGNKVGIADSIYHIGDTDTNIRFPADDTFTVHTASIERFRINSGGQVSIGTTIEGHGNADELTVYNQSNAGITIRSGASDAGMIYFSDATSGTGEYQGKFEYHHSDNSFRVSTGTNERLRITSGGNVGIGSDSPGQKLDVAGNILTRSTDNTAQFQHNALKFQTSGGAHIDHETTNQNLNFRVTKSSTSDTNMMQINAASEQTKFRKIITVGLQGGNDTTQIGGGSGIGAYLQLNYANNSIVNTKLLGNNNSWLNSHYGNVGIGTQTATRKLQVTSHSADPYILVGGSGRDCGLMLDANNEFVALRSDAADRLWVNAKSDGINFTVGGTSTANTKVRIKSDGKVGIGTDNPATILHLENDAPVLTVKATNASSGLRINVKGQSSGQLLRIQDDNTTKFVLEEGGNVGIGTDNPAKTLDVYGSFQVKDSGGTTRLLVHEDSGQFEVNQSVPSWTNTTHDPSPLIKWGWKSSCGNYTFMASGGNASTGAQMSHIISENHGFKVGRSGYDGTDGDILSTAEYFRITNAGKVGIGTNNPTKILDVLAKDGVTQTYIEKQSGSTNNTYTSALTLSARSGGAAAANYGPAIGFQHCFGGSNYAGCLIASQCGSDTNTASIRLYPRNYGYTEAMRISHNGLVNIGAIADNTAIHASGIFNGATPKFEIKLGGASNSYKRLINITNPGAQTGSETLGRVGIKLSLGSEASSGESNKSGIIYAESTSGYNNGTALCLATNNSERLRITSGGQVNIGGQSTQTTHLLHLQSAGDVGIHLRADTDNSGENDNPYISMSQDGSTAQQFKIGMTGDAAQNFATSITNSPFIHANNSTAQPLQFAHMDNLVVSIANRKNELSLHDYSGNSVGGMEIWHRGNDTAAVLKFSGHNNTGTPGQKTFTQLTHKGGNLTFNFNHNGTDRLVIGSDGVVSGDLNDTSDIALKKDIESISTSCIDNIKQLNPVTFKWKDTSRKDIGFIAQEVEDILPDLVNGEDGVKSINTIGLVSQLTKALQEAITKIETLEAKVDALEGS